MVLPSKRSFEDSLFAQLLLQGAMSTTIEEIATLEDKLATKKRDKDFLAFLVVGRKGTNNSHHLSLSHVQVYQLGANQYVSA